MSAFYSIGERLLNDHVLLDVLPDDIATPDKLARHKRVFTISSGPELDGDSYEGLSRFEAPASVRVSASNPERGAVWDIHFVNYSRKEPVPKQAMGLIADENPTRVSGVKADLACPPGLLVRQVQWMTPEAPDLRDLAFAQAGKRVRFSAPEFLVYGVARVHVAAGTSAATARNTRMIPAPRRHEAIRANASRERRIILTKEDCDRTGREHAH
jgi:hypothetical protein